MKHDDTVFPPDEDVQRDPQTPTSSSPSFPPFSPDALEEEAIYFAAESAKDAFLSEVEQHTTHNTIPVLKNSESQVSDWLQALASRAGDMLSCIRREESGSYSVLYISEALTHILGYTPGEFLFFTDEQYIHPSDLNYTRAALQRCLERPEQREVLEYRARHKDQRWRHLESFAITVQLEDGQDGLLMTTRDVTESRERENQLLNRVAWFAALSSQITDVLRVVDRSGHVLVANGRLNWLFGDTSQAIDVETVLSYTHPEDQKQVEEALTHTLDAPGERIRMGFRAHTRRRMALHRNRAIQSTG